MNRGARYERGVRLFEDAVFIRDVVIPHAHAARRWNIVIFETYRVSELFTKSLFFFAGYSPKETHGLDYLIDRWCQILDKAKWSAPFVYSLMATGGNGYGVTIINNRIEFLKRIANTYTLLGSAPLQSLVVDDIMALQIGVDHYCWTVTKDDEVILSGTDASLSEPLRLQRTLVKPADRARVENIKKFLRELRGPREEAFYSERPFTEQEANQAIDRMAGIFELSKAFFVEERLS